jgi:uncharacterized protein
MNRMASQLNHAVAAVLALPVRGYRLLLSPWLGSACRFNPTCSVYVLQALELHGAAEGSYLAAKRLLRCHPWCAGGHDPVPALRVQRLPRF